jgi:hypothetical protein
VVGLYYLGFGAKRSTVPRLLKPDFNFRENFRKLAEKKFIDQL